MTQTASRRGFLRAATGTGLLAAGASTAAAQTTHTVDMTDDLVFDPDSLTIAPGDTVVWENVGTIGHTVTAYEDEIPEEAEFFASGGFDSEDAARGDPAGGNVPGGESYEHTFEVPGSYGYFCIPHESVGMVASLQVQEGGGTTAAGGGPVVPGNAKSLALATTLAMGSILALAYVLMKYGGDYPEAEGEA